MDSVTPKWAREAEEHLVKLSSRLDAAEAYIKSLEALRDEMLAALEAVDAMIGLDDCSEAVLVEQAIAKAKGN
jgi:uncharacterized protein YihD (DUF1040 family)